MELLSSNGLKQEVEHKLSGFLTLESGSVAGTVSVPETSEDDAREHYSGSYVVEPRADRDQYLQTRNKVMDDDMTIKKIAYSETSNASGGYTAYIA